MDKEIRFKRTLFTYGKLTVESFLYVPEVRLIYNDMNKATFNINCSPIVIFAYKGEDNSDYNNNVYKMTPKNHYKTLKFLNEVLGWFYDKSKNDLFFTDTNGDLKFNNEYNNLNAMVKSSYIDTKILKARPNVISFENETYEGIYLHINKLENVVPMPLDELEALFNIVKTFDFQTELLLTLNAMTNIKVGAQDAEVGPKKQTPRRTPFDTK